MKLRGQVLDAHTGMPVADAKVVIRNSQKSLTLTTDESGEFSSEMDTGHSCFSVKKKPYRSQDCNCNCIYSGSNRFLTLFLEIDTLQEEPVTA